MTKAWSPYQLNIFDFIANGEGNAIIVAVAGSGKSTTIVSGMQTAGSNSIFLAFNKSIADELKSRGVNARTFHSLAFGTTLRSRGVRDVNTNKSGTIFEEIVEYELNNQLLTGSMASAMTQRMIYKAFVCKLVGMGKQVGIGCLVPDTPESWYKIINHHDLELESEFADYGRAVALASQILQHGSRPDVRMVDFDDMLYLPVKDGLVLPTFDFVFVDEAQDTNAIQRAMLKKIMHKNSRLIAVGDPAQAIYGFRGSDSNSLALIGEEFNCIRLPLSVTYRCATSIVQYARQWVSHIEPRDGAPEGKVINLAHMWSLTMFQPQDLIVCRTTAPLIAMAYRFMRARIPATVLGKDIGEGIKSLIKKMKARDFDQLELRIEEYAEREIEKAKVQDNQQKIEAIEDKVEVIKFLMDSMGEDERSIEFLVNTIDQLFKQQANSVLLSTVHKAKGLEADTVYWLNRSQCPAFWAKKEWQQEQERNICYVAATRAINTLVMIEDKERDENGFPVKRPALG